MEKTTILNKLLRSKSSVFTFKEVLLISGQVEPQLLKRQLNYYVKKGELYSIRRGIYSKDKNYDHLELATKIYTPSYVSFETILSEAGIIFQHYNKIFAATYQTKEIECDDQIYSFRKIKDVILTNNAGLENRGNYFAASKERAFLDVLYLNKDYHFDNLSPLDFEKIQSLLVIYNNKRMENRVKTYFKNFQSDRG
jgi:predicted transcriptional regulator of viral defense system